MPLFWIVVASSVVLILGLAGWHDLRARRQGRRVRGWRNQVSTGESCPASPEERAAHIRHLGLLDSPEGGH